MRYKLRNCRARADAWAVIKVHDDGSESKIPQNIVTALSPGAAIDRALSVGLICANDSVVFSPG